MEYSLPIKNAMVIMKEPEPIVKFECWTPDKTEIGLIYKFDSTIIFDSYFEGTKFKIANFNVKDD